MSLVNYISYIQEKNRPLVKNVKSTQFCILNPADILKQSVALIDSHVGKNRDNVNGTLKDHRLCSSRDRVNAVTKLEQKLDPGNFGHCVLAKPVFNPLFFDTVIKILNCICINCSLPRYKNAEVKKAMTNATIASNKTRHIFISEQLIKNNGICMRCGNNLPKVKDISKMGNHVLGIRATFVKTKEHIDLTSEICHSILKNITSEDCYILGFDPRYSRPDWMIITVLIIPSEVIRPSVIADNGNPSEDDLTHAYDNILKFNNILRINIEKAETDASEQRNINIYHAAVQINVAGLIDNESTKYAGVHNRTNRLLKTFRSRHKYKAGRVRTNIMGKRVNSSARSVITADPNISIICLGVPLFIAMNLTIPEKVDKNNYSRLATMVSNGPSVYPGAKELQLGTESGGGNNLRRDLKDGRNKSVVLCYGDIVYRHILDGDVVFFNRQPSLHKMSMMAHYAKVLTGKTFRLNPNVTPPYNADFDGDEMNMHLPQSAATANEISGLALVSTQIITPQYSKPCIGLVQDSLLGAYRMSSEHIRGFAPDQIYYLNKKHLDKLLAWTNNYSGKILRPARTTNGLYGWTTRQLFSMFFPDINIMSKGISIKNGTFAEPMPGTAAVPLKSSNVGKSAAGGLFHVCYNDLGQTETVKLLDNFSRLMSQWFMIDGFSVGLSDLEINVEDELKINQIKQECRQKTKELMAGLHYNTYEETRNKIIKENRSLAQNEHEQFEKDIMNIINKSKATIEEITVKSLSRRSDGTSGTRDNKILSMVESGSKGSSANVVQIISELGQQKLDNKRMPDNYLRRPFPHFVKDDLSQGSRGLVESSYIEGLNPIEYIFHASEGRIGLISTTIKTASTGYIQRKLVKILEDITIAYDNTLRNATGNIIQYIYGGDGYDAAKVEPQHFPHLEISMDEFILRYGYDDDDIKNMRLFMTDEAQLRMDLASEKTAMDTEFKMILETREWYRANYGVDIISKVLSPINFERMLLDYEWPSICDLTPMEIIDEFNTLISGLIVNSNNLVNEYALRNFITLIRSKLPAKKLICEYGLSRDKLTRMIKQITTKFYSGLIAPGEAIGMISAQSLGEPTTQLTLDTFHQSGMSEKPTIVDGVKRVMEILSITANQSGPSNSIYIKDDVILGLEINIDGAVMTGREINDDLLTRYNQVMMLSEELQQEQLKQLSETKDKYKKAILKEINKIKSEFTYIKFGDLVDKIEILYDLDEETSIISEDQAFINAWYSYYADTGIFEKENWIIRFEMNKEAIISNNIDLSYIQYIFDNDDKIRNMVSFMFSDINNEKIICRVKLVDITGNPIALLETIEGILLDTKIKGVKDILKAQMTTRSRNINLPNGAIITKNGLSDIYNKVSLSTLLSDDYVINTSGSNLIEILNIPYIFANKTSSNNIREIETIFGIEGARRVIIEEIFEVFDSAGKAPNIRHIELLADIMTYRGTLNSIDRYGAQKNKIGPWARASFEETTKNLISAALFAETDNMKGVSAKVTFGEFIGVGTNSMDIIIDEKVLADVAEPEREFIDFSLKSVQDDKIVEASDLEFNFGL
jgi:DNA-directed RNA polymerase II subunit RPB1